jgi:hypothetical protein
MRALEEPRVPDDYRLSTMAETADLSTRVAVNGNAFDPSR